MIKSTELTMNLLVLMLIALSGLIVAGDKDEDGQLVLSPAQLVRLSELRLLTRHLNPEQKCNALANVIRDEILPEDTASSNEEILMKVIGALRQRKLPMNNKQPILADLEDCLGLDHSESESDANSPVQVIAGPPDSKVDVTSEDPIQGVLDEWKSIKDNVRDYSQDLYRVKDKSTTGSVISIPTPDDRSSVSDGDSRILVGHDTDNQNDDDDDGNSNSDSSEVDYIDESSQRLPSNIRVIKVVDGNSASSEGNESHSDSNNDQQHEDEASPVSVSASATASASASGKWSHSFNHHQSYSYSSSKTGKKTVTHQYSHTSSSDDPPQTDGSSSEQSAESSSESSDTDTVTEAPDMSIQDQLGEAYSVVELLSNQLDESKDQIASLYSQVKELQDMIAQSPVNKEGTEALLEKSRLKTMKELYEKSVNREEKLAKKVRELENKLEQQRKKAKKSKDDDDDDDDEKVRGLDNLAKKLSKEIDPSTNVLERCYKYFLALTMPEKPTKQSLKTIGRLRLRGFSLADFYNDARMLRPLAQELLQSSEKRAVDVGRDILQCLARPQETTTTWESKSFHYPGPYQNIRPIPDLAPIPPMPPMPPFPRM